MNGARELERAAGALDAAERPHGHGEILGDTYRLVRRIGAGGMADVYEVEHLRLQSRFAAKLLRAAHDESARRRFLREARLLASVKSDHIVTVVDTSAEGAELPFYVMELLNGQDLRKLGAGSRQFAVGRAAKLCYDACLGLQVVHAAGIVHRDLKPENLFVTHRDTGEELCKLLDFGVVKAEGGSTEHGALIGTVKYMAPEQIEHAGQVTTRSDVYALGAILYECLVGRPPHVADSVERLLFQILNNQPPPPRSARSEIPGELEALVLSALARDPGERPASVAAFAQALFPFIERGALAELDTQERTIASGPLSSRPSPSRRRRSVSALIAIGALLGLGVYAERRTATPASAEPVADSAGRAAPAAASPVPPAIGSLTAAPIASAPARVPAPVSSVASVSRDVPRASRAQPAVPEPPSPSSTGASSPLFYPDVAASAAPTRTK